MVSWYTDSQENFTSRSLPFGNLPFWVYVIFDDDQTIIPYTPTQKSGNGGLPLSSVVLHGGPELNACSSLTVSSKSLARILFSALCAFQL